MKINKIFFILFFLSFIFSSNGTTWTIQVLDFQFNPANLTNVTVGDSIKWQWVNGIHTSTSGTIPSGASPWNSTITSTSQTFIYVVTTAGNYHYVCIPHAPNMAGDFTVNPIGIKPISGNIPAFYNLYQNYPNPFNPVTNIKIDIAKTALVVLNVYDILGNEVESLVKQELSSGSYSVNWNAANFPTGVYIYKLTAGNFTSAKKMILIK